MDASDYQKIRQLFDDYLRMYSSRDDRLTTYFSDDFSGFTGGGDFLVKDREEWIAITRQDFAQVKDPIRIELKDLAIQSLSDTIAVTTGFFNIHLPIKDHILSRETARLVLIFRKESTDWKISHSSISIPYYLVREGEVYPLQELVERNQLLEEQVAERTRQLSEANNNFKLLNKKLAKEIEERTQAEIELAQREKALANSERFLKAIINTEPECIKLLDSDCNVLMMNPAGLEMIEADSFEQVKGQCVCPLITDPYRNDFFALTKQVFQGIPATLEFETIGLKGRHVWLETHAVPFRNEHGEIVSLLGITRDVTERKKGEKALQENKDLLAEIIELSPISMAIVSMDGTIEQINRRAIETFGYPHDDIPNMERWWIQAYPDESYRAEVIAQWMGLVGKALAEKSEIERREYRVTCKDGTVRTTLIFGIPVSDKIFVMFDDITERKRAEEDRLVLERQLLQAQKMESLGVLAGGIAHDFNNILTAIVGNTELALMRLNPESPVLDNLKRIEKSAVRATDLAKQMLAYSGKGKFVIEPIDINRLVQEMGHMLDVSISKKAVLRYNLTEPLPTVEVDATQIRQVVMNLVINASEAIGESNGYIAITTGCIDCDKNYLKDIVLDKSIKAGRYVYLEIADSGCGMDQETLAKVFDPFFTTKFTGRGLGMAAVQGIVRGHKGFINVNSEPDKGTTIRMFLPASDKVVENADDQTHQEDWRGEGTVLLVDDEETVRNIGKDMLEILGFTVITAKEGNEAIEVFMANPDIAFVILDLTMPQMDGEECFRELKQLKSDLKVVISSGFSEQEVSQKFAGRGIAGFIQKPYKLSVLKEAIQKI
jgi:PAS domain S-box-containing protein